MGHISVVIPCYNYGAYLTGAIESVLAQTRQPLEVIVMDDASTDDTESVARRYPVQYVKNLTNLGAVGNFNKGVALAKGEYVMLLDADNRLRPDYLAKTAAVLDANPKIAVVYTHMALFGPRAAEVFASQPAWQAGQSGEFYLWQVPEFNSHRLMLGNYINGSSLFRKSVWKQAGGHPVAHRAEDWLLWKKIIQLGWAAKLVPEYLLEYRQHTAEQRNVVGKSRLVGKFKQWTKLILMRLGLLR